MLPTLINLMRVTNVVPTLSVRYVRVGPWRGTVFLNPVINGDDACIRTWEYLEEEVTTWLHGSDNPTDEQPELVKRGKFSWDRKGVLIYHYDTLRKTFTLFQRDS